MGKAKTTLRPCKLVPVAGVEPARLKHDPLKVACLPFHHTGYGFGVRDGGRTRDNQDHNLGLCH